MAGARVAGGIVGGVGDYGSNLGAHPLVQLKNPFVPFFDQNLVGKIIAVGDQADAALNALALLEHSIHPAVNVESIVNHDGKLA